MTTQTARTTILTTPGFKAWLIDEAKKEGVSISELVRQRCQAKPNQDELLLSAVLKEVQEALPKAYESLTEGLKDANSVLAEIRGNKS